MQIKLNQTVEEEWVGTASSLKESRGWWNRDREHSAEWASEGEQKCESRVCETELDFP